MGFLYPIYLAVNGLQTDIFKIDLQSLWIVGLILMVAFVVKICAVMLPGYFYNLPMKQCCVIGLLLNGRGIAELTMYNMWIGSKVCIYVCAYEIETSEFNFKLMPKMCFRSSKLVLRHWDSLIIKIRIPNTEIIIFKVYGWNNKSLVSVVLDFIPLNRILDSSLVDEKNIIDREIPLKVVNQVLRRR